MSRELPDFVVMLATGLRVVGLGYAAFMAIFGDNRRDQ